MIKAVIFDCFGVLTADTWKEFTATLPESQLAMARDLNRSYDAGFITKEKFTTEVYELTGKRPIEVEALLDNEVGKNTQLLGHIKKLKTQYKIGLLSNIGTSWIEDKFLSKEEQNLFDTMVFSYKVQMTKPDPRIFELVCNKLSIFPREAILIDDVDRNCNVAEEVGMRSIVYTDFASMKDQLEGILSANAND